MPSPSGAKPPGPGAKEDEPDWDPEWDQEEEEEEEEEVQGKEVYDRATSQEIPSELLEELDVDNEPLFKDLTVRATPTAPRPGERAPAAPLRDSHRPPPSSRRWQTTGSLMTLTGAMAAIMATSNTEDMWATFFDKAEKVRRRRPPSPPLPR